MIISKSILSVGRISTRSFSKQPQIDYVRSLTTTPALRTSKTQELEEDHSLYIENNLKLSIKNLPNETHIETNIVDNNDAQSKIDLDKACALCRLNLRPLNYTDVMILSQFIKRNGSLVTYHESNLCSKQYLNVMKLIKQAQRCNLIQRPPDYFVPGAWHDLNTYLEIDRRRDQPIKIIKKQYWKL